VVAPPISILSGKGYCLHKKSALKARRRRPVRRYNVRVYDEKTAQQLEELAEATGYREMSPFFVETPLRNPETRLSPFEIQALKVLGFQLAYQGKVVDDALEKLKADNGAEVHGVLAEQAAQSKEVLALVKAILGDAPSHESRGKRGKR
jgi:hypothetical protein